MVSTDDGPGQFSKQCESPLVLVSGMRMQKVDSSGSTHVEFYGKHDSWTMFTWRSKWEATC